MLHVRRSFYYPAAPCKIIKSLSDSKLVVGELFALWFAIDPINLHKDIILCKSPEKDGCFQA